MFFCGGDGRSRLEAGVEQVRENYPILSFFGQSSSYVENVFFIF